MRTSTITFFITSLLFTACAKDQKEIAQDLGLLPAGCGADGARLQVVINDNTFCADLQIIATGGEGSVIVTGINLAGSTLVVQFDDLAEGSHAITEAANGVLYMQGGVSYTVAPGVEGVLNILHHDPDARSLKATFQVAVYNELNGNTRQLEGELEVTYSVGG